MTDEYLYPRGATKDPRLDASNQGYTSEYADIRPSTSPWEFCTVLPRTDVEGRKFGTELPEYQRVLEYNPRRDEYRTRPLTEVIDDDNE